MFEHDCLDTCAVLGVYACILDFCICTCSAQLSMFHMERNSRNTISINIIILPIKKLFASNKTILLKKRHGGKCPTDPSV